METVSQDAWPRNSPAAAAVAVLILTLGFGALAAVLIADKAVFLDALPFRAPARVATLQGIFEQKGEVQDWGISHIDFLDWRQQNKVFDQMATYSGEVAFNLKTSQGAERVTGELVSYNYFPLLGGTAAVGRFFTPEEDGKPFVHPVVVLGYDLWQRRFGGDKGVVGRSLDLNGAEYHVVGVAAQGFHGLTEKAEAWIPSSMPPGPEFVEVRRMRWLSGVAVLKPGVTVPQAQADMNRITSALAEKYPDMNKGMGVRLSPLRDYWFTRDLRQGLRTLTLGAALLLLLACASSAALLHARQATLSGSLLLVLTGAMLGLALASWATPVLAAQSGVAFPSFVHLTAGPGVIAAVLALAAVCGLAVGRAALAAPGGWRRFQLVSLVLQIGLAVALVVNAGIAAAGYRRAVSEDLGFAPRNLLTLRVDLQGPRYATDPAVVDLVRRYLDRLPKLPGVKTLAIGGPTIPTDPWAGGYITIEDHASDAPDGIYPIMTHGVSPAYFQALGTPIVRGRAFTMDDAGMPFGVIVSKAMAEQQWPKQDPIGKRLKFGVRGNPTHPWLPVVGVAADVQHQGLMADKRPAPDLYLPVLSSPIRLPMTLNFLVRPQDGVAAASLAPALEREILAIDPDSPPYDAATMEERLGRQTAGGRFRVALAALFAGMAVILAAAAVMKRRGAL